MIQIYQLKSDHHVSWVWFQWWTSSCWSYLLYDSCSTFRSLVFRGHICIC